MNIKQITKKMPVIGQVALYFYHKFTFRDSENYWINRYKTGGNSGAGSYNQLAKFKSEILNKFVLQNDVGSIIEHGCGDGNQLNLAEYPEYIGFDVSPKAITMCERLFENDKTKTFKLAKEYIKETAELALSLDVIYHLVEDSVYIDYMNRLFDSAERFVIIYSSNTDNNSRNSARHVKHRKFSKWITDNRTDWELVEHIPNLYPFKGDNNTGSLADFYVYTKQ